MKKTFVLDTNVLLHDPKALFRFEENDVVIPIWVVEEIDLFKREVTEIGRNAREASRELDVLRMKGPISEGVELETGGKLSICMDRVQDELPPTLSANKADNLILGVALAIKKKKKNVVLVSKDTNLRIKANALGVEAQDYERGKIQFDELYSGWTGVKVEGAFLDKLYKERRVKLSELDASLSFHLNELIHFECLDGGSKSALARFEKDEGVVLLDDQKPIWGITARNKEQRFALDLLMNDKISLVTLVGKAGTGKTLLAIAAGLYKVADLQVYKKMLVTRPIFPLGKDIGFLPGEMEEKLKPWMQPIFDNLELLLHLTEGGDKGKSPYKELVEHGILQIEALTYIRGRSIPCQYMIVDEAQNLTPHEVKTILTRAGENTKVVMTGDPYQIDNPYVDASSNGLTYVAEKFKEHPLAGHITLTKGERSGLAEAAANML